MNINALLKKTIEAGASDLILEENSPFALRINGSIKFEEKTLSAEEVSSLTLPMLSVLQKERLEKERQLDFAYSLSTGERFRINLHYQQGTLAAAIRVIPKKIPTRTELNLPEIIEEIANLKSGLVIVTGPTGCGKTTTQACMIEFINQQRAEHIVTIEDPIEFVFENKKSIIEQREIGSDVLDFADGLRGALRENPNVILIGEMRDYETIAAAITAAETGHLVISTLHTSNVVNAIDRMIDVFPANQQNQIRSQLSQTLQIIIAQKLLSRKDKPGLIVALEILKANPAIKNLIRKGQTYEIPSMIEVGRKFGMQSMDAALQNLTNKGFIDKTTALEHAASIENLEKLLSGK